MLPLATDLLRLPTCCCKRWSSRTWHPGCCSQTTTWRTAGIHPAVSRSILRKSDTPIAPIGLFLEIDLKGFNQFVLRRQQALLTKFAQSRTWNSCNRANIRLVWATLITSSIVSPCICSVTRLGLLVLKSFLALQLKLKCCFKFPSFFSQVQKINRLC